MHARRTLCSLAAALLCLLPSLAHASPSALALTATPVVGRNAVEVTISGPAGVPVVVTLTATIDPDLPTVLVGRNHVTIDTSGTAHTVLTLAPDYWRGSQVTITATSIDGVTPASVSVHIVAPHPELPYPSDKGGR